MKFFSHSSFTACKQPTIVNGSIYRSSNILDFTKNLPGFYFQVLLEESDILLKTYTSEQIPVLGEMKVRVYYLQQSQDLWLEAVSGKGQNRMGCNCWKRLAEINTVRTSKQTLETFMQKYAETFN